MTYIQNASYPLTHDLEHWMDYFVYLLLNSKDLENTTIKLLPLRMNYMNRKEYNQFPWQNK